MRLKVERVQQSNQAEFVRYCAGYGSEHDDSYLPGDDFTPSPDQPSYLLSDGDSVVGAVSLMRSQRFEEAGLGRFAIFHSKLGTADAYQRLVEAIRPNFEGLGAVYMFVPSEKLETAEILKQLGFEIERYSFVLLNREPGIPEVRFPDGFELRELDPSHNESVSAFAASLNANFSELAGHLDLPAEEVRGWFDDPTYLQGGIQALMQDGQLAGTISITREYEDPNLAEVSAFGVNKELRGRGLGRMLLRAGVSFAVTRGFPAVILSVNAENESALSLYRSEGFEVIETVVCYRLFCP